MIYTRVMRKVSNDLRAGTPKALLLPRYRMLIIDLILEIWRLRKILKSHGIDSRTGNIE